MSAGSDGQKMIFAGDDGTVAANIEEGIFSILDKDRKEQGKISFAQMDNGYLCGSKEKIC